MTKPATKSNAADRAKRIEAYPPLSGMVVPRFAGISTFMRLPILDAAKAPGEIDIARLGIPFDGATTNRPGTRLGPRQVREASSLMRLVNYGTHVAPYSLAVCAAERASSSSIRSLDGAVADRRRSAWANQFAALAGASRAALSPASRRTATAATSPSRADRST